MMADAADEAHVLTAFCDNEASDTSLQLRLQGMQALYWMELAACPENPPRAFLIVASARLAGLG